MSATGPAGDANDTLPVWRKLYQIVSGSVVNIVDDVVDDALKLCKNKLQTGLLDFKPYTPKSFEEWKKQLEKTNITQDAMMCSFIKKLAINLDLDVPIAWSVICNFLIYEYYGKIDELRLIIRYEADTKCLIEHIWNFYTSNRRFMLKTLRFIFEKSEDTNYVHYNHFQKFLEDIDINKLCQNLISTYEDLVHEIAHETAGHVPKDLLIKWLHRNDREKIEVGLLLIYALKHANLSGEELPKLVEIFISHGFGRTPVYSQKLPAAAVCDPKDVFDIKCVELGCLAVLASRYKQKIKQSILLSDCIEKTLEYVEMKSAECTGTLIIWAVIKQMISDTHLAYSKEQILASNERKGFIALSKIVCSQIFQDCKAGRIVKEGFYDIVVELMEICKDCLNLFETEGIIEIASELCKQPHLNAIEKLEPLFEKSLELFPFIMDPFLNMCTGLIQTESGYRKVSSLIRNIPTFCSGLIYDWYTDTTVVNGTQALFRGSSLFIIPDNTPAFKSTYQDGHYVTIIYPYDFYKLVRQYFEFFIKFALDRNEVNDDVLMGIKKLYGFLIEYVKQYRGNLNEDKDLLGLLSKLDCIPAYFNKGVFAIFDLFELFFEAKCSLVIRNKADFRLAFPLIVSKCLFPHVTDINNIHDECTSMHTKSSCVLFTFLKIEEKTKNHSLLLLYVNLIADTIQKNHYYKEIQIPGIWYLLNIVFPLHQQWTYGDPNQEMLVLKGCLKAFIQAFQRKTLDDGSENLVYKLCLVSFMKNKWLISSLHSIFSKNRFELDPVMEKESNWISGPATNYIECVRLELVLWLYLFKDRATLPQNDYYIFDECSSSIAKSISVQLINPYNCTINILAIKILDVLAHNNSIPLLASIGLDHDQVQRLFLDRLRDPMEDQDVQLNILNLISTCIKYQNAMTAAFFNIQCAKKWYSDIKGKILQGDTMSDFMMDYLHNIKKSHEFLKSPLQVGILKVMAQLWMCGKHHLIKDITSDKSFWNLLINPLYKELNQSPSVYAYIFKILSLQFLNPGSKPADQQTFLKELEKYFNDLKNLQSLKSFILNSLMHADLTSDNIEERAFFMNNISELVIKSGKQNEIKMFSDNESRYCLVQLCLEGFQRIFVSDYLLETWIDFCLTVFNTFKLQFEDKKFQLNPLLTKAFSVIKIKYTSLDIRTRKKVTCLINIIVSVMKGYFEENRIALIDFLEEIGPIFEYEFKLLEEQVWINFREVKCADKKHIVPWTLLITTVNTFLKMKNNDACKVWLGNYKYLTKVTQSLASMMLYKETLPLGKIIIYSLILYVKSPMAFDLMQIDFPRFFDSLEPSLTTLLLGKDGTVQPFGLKEGWLWCTLLFQFNEELIKRFEVIALQHFFTFIKMYEKILDHIVYISECSADIRSLDLITSMLKLFHAVQVHWNVYWYIKSNDTYNFMVNCATKMINVCLYVILRPKSIILYIIDEYHRLMPLEQAQGGNKLSHDLMTCIINRLLNILEWSFACLYKVNPSLIDMLDIYKYPWDTRQLIIDDFSVPKFDLPIQCELTYGKLICLAHFLCKTLNQLHQTPSKPNLKINEEKLSVCCALLEHQDPLLIPTQRLSACLRYSMYEYSDMSTYWLNKVDPERIKSVTDCLSLFIAQHVFLHIKSVNRNEAHYFKRNLWSELSFINEHTKQKASEILTVPQMQRSPLKPEYDILKGYLMKCKADKKMNLVADENFLIVISHWIFNICQVPSPEEEEERKKVATLQARLQNLQAYNEYMAKFYQKTRFPTKK